MLTAIKLTYTLFRKELLLEWRQRYAIGSIVLYVVSTVFIVYASFQNIKAPAWNALFWIIQLFAAVNAVAKSFVQESGKRQLYYYSLAHPLHLIAAKVVYNTLLLFLLAVLAFATMTVFVSNPVVEPAIFWGAVALGSLGFAAAFTFVSAIATKTGNSGTMMAILSFPVIIPLLLSLLKVSTAAIGLTQDTALYKDFLILGSIDAILLALIYLLFPFLWRD